MSGTSAHVSPGPLTLRLVLPVPEGLLRTPASALSRGSGRLTWPDTRPHLSSSVPDKSWLYLLARSGLQVGAGESGSGRGCPAAPTPRGPFSEPHVLTWARASGTDTAAAASPLRREGAGGGGAGARDARRWPMGRAPGAEPPASLRGARRVT